MLETFNPKEPKVSRSEYMQLLADRFESHAKNLQEGRSCQPTIMLPLRYLFKDTGFEKRFSLLLLREAMREHSVAKTRNLLVSEGELKEICDLGGMYLKSPQLKNSERLQEIRNALLNRQPGWKRVWVHATRRKAQDKFALLAEEVIENLLEIFRYDMGYRVARLYVFDYIDGRYRASPQSACRLGVIAGHLRGLAN